MTWFIITALFLLAICPVVVERWTEAKQRLEAVTRMYDIDEEKP